MRQAPSRLQQSDLKAPPLAQYKTLDLKLHPIAKRIEDYQDHNGNQDGIHPDGVELPNDGQHHIKEARNKKGNGAGNHQPSQHLVQVQQALVAKRLRENKQEDQAEDCAYRRGVIGGPVADDPCKVGDRKQPSASAYASQKSHAAARGARPASSSALGHFIEPGANGRGREQEDGNPGKGVFHIGTKCQKTDWDRYKDAQAPHARALTVFALTWHHRLEKVACQDRK